MAKCPSCGMENADGAKFCMNCGGQIPQVKKCPSCGMELPLNAKFCFGCGKPLDGSAPAGGGAPASGLNMGNDNVISGDVIGQKIAGDNVGNKVMGNATFTTVQDDTKRVNNCAVCGCHLTNDTGHTCPRCNKVVCYDHFDHEKFLCVTCVKEKHVSAVQEYERLLVDVYADGKVDVEERYRLNTTRERLGLSQSEADEMEKKFISSSKTNSLTRSEKFAIEDAENNLLQNHIADALSAIEPIYQRHPNDEGILTIYLRALRSQNPDKALSVVRSLKSDFLEAYLSNVEINMIKGRMDEAEIALDECKQKWPDELLVKCCEARYLCALAEKTKRNSILDEANSIAESLDNPANEYEAGAIEFVKTNISIAMGGKPTAARLSEYWKAQLPCTDLVVSCDGSTKISSLAEALAKASDGDTITVKSGEYVGHFVIDKAVIIKGEDPDDVPVFRESYEESSFVFELRAAATLENICVGSSDSAPDDFNCFDHKDRGEYWAAIAIFADAKLRNVDVCEWYNDGIDVIGGANPTLENCSSHENAGDGIFMKNGFGTFTECSSFDNSGDGFSCKEGSNPTVVGCEFYGNHYNVKIYGGSKGSFKKTIFREAEKANGWLKDEGSDPQFVDCEFYDAAEAGLLLEAKAHATFEKCDMNGNGHANIFLREDSFATVLNCKIHDGKQSGITIKEDTKASIKNCDIYGNGYGGMVIEGNPTVEDTKIHDGKQNGLWIKGKAEGTFKNCDIYGNAYPNVDVDSCTDPFRDQHFVNCKIHDGKQGGMWIKKGSMPTIEDCSIFANTNANIDVDDGSAPRIRRCKIYNGQKSGIFIHKKSTGVYEDCDIYGNANPGFVIGDESNPEVTNCKVHDGKQGGIWIKQKSTGTYKGCETYGNTNPGFDIDSGANPMIINCSVHEAQSNGVRFEDCTGTMDGCKIYGCESPNFVIKKNANPLIKNCSSTDSKQNGMWFKDAGRGRIENCDISNNQRTNVDVSGGSNPTFVNCTVNGSKEKNGFFIHTNSSGTYTGCSVNNNTTNAFRVVEESTPVIENCSAKGNGGKSVDIEGGNPKVKGGNLEGYKAGGLFNW